MKIPIEGTKKQLAVYEYGQLLFKWDLPLSRENKNILSVMVQAGLNPPAIELREVTE